MNQLIYLLNNFYNLHSLENLHNLSFLQLNQNHMIYQLKIYFYRVLIDNFYLNNHIKKYHQHN